MSGVAAAGGGVPWVSFDAADGDTWLFDAAFFGSSWQCIWGNGCQGIEETQDADGMRGCCSYGAHFADLDDLHRVMDVAAALPAKTWQHHAVRPEPHDGLIDREALVDALTVVDEDGDRVTTVVDGACVFLNRPGFAGGAGCAFHVAASAADIEPLEWKPEVCWQLPLRVEHHVDDHDHATHFVRQWLRRDWGEAGDDLGWWCDGADAHVGTATVAETLQAEVGALAGTAIASALVDYVVDRTPRTETHVAIRSGDNPDYSSSSESLDD